MGKMTKEEHIKVHKELHKNFDNLLADFILMTDKLPSKTSLTDFMKWSHEQTINPTVKE